MTNLPAIITAGGVLVAAISSLLNGYYAAHRDIKNNEKLNTVHQVTKEIATNTNGICSKLELGAYNAGRLTELETQKLTVPPASHPGITGPF